MSERDEETVEPGESGSDTTEVTPEGDGEAEEAGAQPDPPTVDPEVARLQADNGRLSTELAEAQARLRTVSKAYTDLQKEMHSFRERTEQRAKSNLELQAFEQAKAFFDPVMNLKRALQNAGSDVESLVGGLKMVHQQFMDALQRLGLQEVPGEGATFDPNVHEALAVTPVSDPELDGKVLQVHTNGYAVDGRVLQAAQVVIGKYQEPAGEA